MKYLAIDYGAKRIGLATSDPEGRLAFAHSTIERFGHKRDTEAVLNVARATGARSIVVGLPASLDENAEMGESEKKTRSFMKALEAGIAAADLGLPVEWWDERFSTREAQAGMRAGGISERQGRTAGDGRSVDARAAAVILQAFLDNRLGQSAPVEKAVEPW